MLCDISLGFNLFRDEVLGRISNERSFEDRELLVGFTPREALYCPRSSEDYKREAYGKDLTHAEAEETRQHLMTLQKPHLLEGSGDLDGKSAVNDFFERQAL